MKLKKGQSLVEYGLILALVSVVAIVVLTAMGEKINQTIQNVNTQLDQVLTDDAGTADDGATQ